MVGVIGVSAFVTVVVWALLMRRYRPNPQLVHKQPAELGAALAASDGAETWHSLSTQAQNGLADFVGMALTPHGRRQRAATVASKCAAGREVLDEWMRANAGIRQTGTYYGAPF